MAIKNIISIYRNIYKRLTPLKVRSKVPDGIWRNLTDQEILLHDGNFAWILDNNDLVIDVDVKENSQGLASFVSLMKDSNLDNISPTVITPSGGYHYYFNLPAQEKKDAVSRRIKKNFSQYPGIDFLSKGDICVVAGSKIRVQDGNHRFTKMYQFYDFDTGITQPKIPKDLYNNLINKSSCNYVLLNKHNKCSNIKNLDSSVVTEIKILEVLKNVESDNYDIWIKWGMALKSWDIERGFILWLNWSKNSIKYDFKESIKKWWSFQKKENGIKIKDLIYTSLRQSKISILDQIKIDIQSVSSLSILEQDFLPRISTLNLGLLTIDLVANIVKKHCIDYLNCKPSLGLIRKLITPTYTINSEFIDLCSKFTYVSDINRYVQDDLTFLKTYSMNVVLSAKFHGDFKYSVALFAIENSYINVVRSITCIPSEQKFITENGFTVLNTYPLRMNLFIKPSNDYSSDFGELCSLFLFHLDILSGDEPPDNLLYWLVHNVKYPGRKIFWSPIIQGIPGIGKSYLADLFRKIMGDNNVTSIRNKSLNSDFNSWCDGGFMAFGEEIFIYSNGIKDALSDLKLAITNTYIDVEKKGCDPVRVRNITNYIFLTNFRGSLPIENEDRRFYVLFSKFKSTAEFNMYLRNKLNISNEAYFFRLRSLFENSKNLADLVKWFTEQDIKADSILNAPYSQYKDIMRSQYNLDSNIVKFPLIKS